LQISELGGFLVTDDDFVWKDFPVLGLIVRPTRKLSKTGWVDDTYDFAYFGRLGARQVLVQEDGNTQYVGSFDVGEVKQMRASDLPQEVRLVVHFSYSFTLISPPVFPQAYRSHLVQ
jgi:hypothetical protein